jgi:heat shock protein HtpX
VGRRMGYFLGTNLALMALVGVVTAILGSAFGIQVQGMVAIVIFAAVFGMGGAFISLAMSKRQALRMTGGQVIDKPSNEAERWVKETTHRLADEAGIGRPDVVIYSSPDLNAFATGAKRDDALVAVSTGLLASMQRNEIEAVLAHEVSHISNGDMITLTLIQGVLNTAVLILARVLGRFIDSAISGGRDRGPGFAYFMIVLVLQVALGFLASMVVMYFSRRREFRADAGGGSLTSNADMAQALERLRAGAPVDPRSELPEEVSTMGIRGGTPTGIRKLLMTHPPIEDRIAALHSA